MAPESLILPSLEILQAFNYAVRQRDEWFDEPDDIGRLGLTLETFLQEVRNPNDPIEVAGTLGFRIARGQAFGEGNKRTARLAIRWILDHNGLDGYRILPPGDERFNRLLVRAAMGEDARGQIIRSLRQRS